MRLKRGSGLDGLAAIPERGAWAGIAVLRPLLDVPKARLVATLERGRHRLSSSTRATAIRASSARGCGQAGCAGGARTRRPRRWRCRRGGSGARAKRSIDSARDFLAANSEMSEAGYALIDREALDSGAARDRAPRAGAVDRRCGRRRDARAARQARSICLPPCTPIPARPTRSAAAGSSLARAGSASSARCGARACPMLQLAPGERLLWDNRFRVELGAQRAEARRRAGAGRVRLARPCASARRSPHRCRAWRAGRCPRAGGAMCCWDCRCFGAAVRGRDASRSIAGRASSGPEGPAWRGTGHC